MTPHATELNGAPQDQHGSSRGPVSEIWRRTKIGVLAVGFVAALASCASPRALMSGAPDAHVVTEIGPELPARAARAGAAFQRNPKDTRAAIAYAKALREIGSAEEAAGVLATAASHHPNDKDVLTEYAKALTAAGKGEESLGVFAAARRVNPNDWSLISAEGIALDQAGRHGEARKRYEEALKIVPNHPDVMTNLALSHSLSGNLSASEAILRRAAQQRGAGTQVRQNLALVLALRGRFDEAERILADLDPATAQTNLAAMRQMYEQPALWAQANGIAPVGGVAALPLNAENLASPGTAFKSGAPAVGVTAATRKAPPAAQSTPRARAPLTDPPGNGPDTTFFSFGY